MKNKGIDVSKHQGFIDWKKAKADGVQFAMIRAGWTHYSGGLDVDLCFKYNIESAIANNIDVGVYVYSYDRSVAAAKIAAQKLVALIKPYKLTYPVVFDMEYEDFNKITGKRKLNTDICIAFLEELEKAGYYSMLYCSTDFFHNYVELGRLTKYDKWVAQYASECSLSVPYGIWQYSSKGTVAGVNGNCDMNWGYKDYPTIIRNAKLNHLDDMPVKPVDPPKPVDPTPELYGIHITHFCGIELTKEKADEFVKVLWDGKQGNYCSTVTKGDTNMVVMQSYKTRDDAEARAVALRLLGWSASVKVM